MRESESFDAFYARTVRSVTGEMQSFTRGAEQTEYAVREAYSRAFQQWYEVSGFRDAEGWVLDVAKEIFRRHASAAGGAAAGGAPASGAAPGRGPYGGFTPGGPAADSPAADPPYGGFTPGTPYGRFTPGTPHGGFTPGGPQGGFTPGGPAAGTPAADPPYGGFTPGTPHGGFTPGGPQGGFTPGGPAAGTPATDPPYGGAPHGGGPAGGGPVGNGQFGSPAYGSATDDDATVLPGFDGRWAGHADDGLPAAGLPPAGLPPAGLPPASLPPASLPPASLPPAGLPGGRLPGGRLPGGRLPGGRLPGGTADPTAMMAGPRFPTFGEASPGQTALGPAGDPHGFGPPGPSERVAAGERRRSLPGLQANRGLVAIAVAVVIVVVAVGAYLAFGGHSHKHQTASSHAKTTVRPKPKPHMLADGKVGGRRSIPWSLVTSGWTLAELSSALPNASGGSAGGGTSALYLVDPKGGRYFISQWTSEPEPTLLAWSGDGQTALLETTSNAAGVPSFSYSLLTVATGKVAGLPLPADVTAVGFTRPDGLAILAVHQSGGKLQLQRYALSGSLQATIGSMSHNPSQPGFEPGNCGSYCGALSAPNGKTDVWGTRWNTMRLVSNAGGKVLRRFHVGSGKKSAPCAPVSWWNDTTVLADCAASQPSPLSDQLWLVPADGAAPTPVASASGTPQGVGFDLTATQSGSTTYVTQTSSNQCPGAATGPGGLDIEQVGTDGALSNVVIPRSTSTRNTVLAANGTRLLVLAQTSCPGSYSLLWFYPSKDSSQMLLSPPSGTFGVIAAVPFSTF